ncbi:MAG: HAD-IIA family hydrolase [Anaerolineae bacterium]|nr:HAD-IIA family hydrolase [Anaerolineae bacterium]
MELKRIKALILDMDGVLWRGSEPIGDLPAIFSRIRERGVKVVFATNNSTRTPGQYVQKLAGFGAEAQTAQIFTSAKATAAALSERYPAGGGVFVVGEGGLVEALLEKGFSQQDGKALAVVAGLDSEVTYEKLKRATLLIRGGAVLMGTNPDKTLPSPEGLAPGAGAIIAALEAASGVKAEIIGKPQATMFQQALSQLGLPAEEALVVGDRLETDIAGGQAAGCKTALVLSGVTTREMAEAWEPAADLILEDLTTLAAKL